MKKNLLIPALLLFTVFSCDKEDITSVQSESFIKYYTNYSVFTAADVEALNPSGYAILGTAKVSDLETRICLIRTDAYGNSIDSVRTYGFPSENNQPIENRAYCLKALADDGFAILGSSVSKTTGKKVVYFIRTNSEGDTLWTRTLTQPGDVVAKHFETDSQGSFYMTGYTVTPLYGKQVWWFALNSDGSNLFVQPQPSGFDWDDEGSFVQILSDGELIITGYTSTGTIRKSFVLRTNKEGGGNNFFSIDSVNEQGTCIRALDNSSLIVLSTVQKSGISHISTHGVNSSSGGMSLAWSNTYVTPQNDVSKSLITDGSTIYILATTGATGTNTAISLLTCDMLGNVKDRSDFGLGTKLSASSFKRTPDGGFIIVGTNTHPEENNTAIVLIKTKANLKL